VPWRHGNRHHEQNRPNRLTRKRDCRSTSSLMARAMLGGSGIWDEKVMNVVKCKDAPFLSPSSWIPKTTMYEMYFVAHNLKRTQNLNASGPAASCFDRGKILCKTHASMRCAHQVAWSKYCDPSAWICNHLDVTARIGFLFPPVPVVGSGREGTKKIAWKLWHVILFKIIVSIVLDQFSQVDRTYHDQAMNHSWTLLFKVPSLLKVFRHCNARIDQSPNLPTCHNILTSDNCQLIQLFCMTVTCQMF
jgi:hypothetical protein